jgi:3-oxosteroid 1-dehydrogenase
LDPAAYRLLEAFYDNGSVMIDRMMEIGAAKFLEFRVGVDQLLPPDYGDHLPENKVPQGRSLTGIDADGKPSAGGIGDGGLLIGQLEKWLRAKNVPILTSHKVTKLIQENGRVVGVEAEHGGKTLRVRADKGVIFGTGGFAQNTDYVQLYQKFMYGACALSSSTGDFISIAGTAGARLGNLQSAWRAQVVLEEALQNRLMPQCVFFVPGDSMIIVNKYGKRVVDEKRNYNDRTKVHFSFDPLHEDYPNQLTFMIFDDRTLDAYAGAYPIPAYGEKPSYIVAGATVEELTANLKKRLGSLADQTGRVALDSSFAAALKGTIARFNGYAKTGQDTEFNRGQPAYDRVWQSFFSIMRKGTKYGISKLPNGTMYPLEAKGPLYAVILGAGALDTNGGPMIDEHARVLGAGSIPIPGLYGAGNCIASPTRETYLGAGGTIGLAMTFGYLAAQHATREPSAT